MKLSLVVPVYNEAKQLREVISYFFRFSNNSDYEWIFIDDKSDDNSLEILRELQKKHNYILIEQSINQGKGAAVIAGIKVATGDLIMIQDADFEYDITDVAKLLVPFNENHADVVYGSRFKKTATQVHRTYHYFVNRLLTLLSNLFSGIYLTDMETCYKIFKADLLRSMSLTSKRFGIEVEITAYLAKTCARIHELPISYYPRTKLQGKKINWKDGLAALFHLVRFNFLVTLEQAFINLPAHYHPDIKRSKTLHEIQKPKGC